jgi:tetratricopeptide (TPR) repeat protein
MKKQKRSARASAPASAEPAPRRRTWWPWAAALAALALVFSVYGPALNGAFVLDDRSLMFMSPAVAGKTLVNWIASPRPMLMFSYWLDYQQSGADPHSFHVTNVFLHLLVSVLVALICARFLAWANVVGRRRDVLAVFSGALFLLHPLQTESVAYVASRSEVLSVFFCFAAYALFLYKSDGAMTWPRALAIVVLFGAAVVTKEHTVMLPALVLLTDYFWKRGGLRKNAILYGMIALAGAGGAFFVLRTLRNASTAGFRLRDLSPGTYFFTQCRVIWIYLRLFLLPFGQNVDADIPLSRTLLDPAVIAGLVGLLALVTAAWIYRKRWPLAAFGVFVFLLLLAPTSSFVPIRDVLAERRVYLPFLGLLLIGLEFLRRLRTEQIVWAGAAVVLACAALTYQRNQVWASPLALWQDAVAKSPRKMRPRFQLAYEYYQQGQNYGPSEGRMLCQQAAGNYEAASRLAPLTYDLLVDWALALDCAGRDNEAIYKLQQAELLENSAHVHAQMGMVYAKSGRVQEALQELAQAEKINPRFEMTYVYRGNIAEMAGDRALAAQLYRRALAINPSNTPARAALIRMSGR